MLFDSDNGDTGIVRDALGEIIFSPISGDTETGRVVCYKRAYKNDVEICGGGIVRERHVYRAPLTVSPLGDFKPGRYQGCWATPVYREVIVNDEGY